MPRASQTKPGILKRIGLIALWIMTCLAGNSQGKEQALQATVKAFHQALVEGNRAVIDRMTDEQLSFGHSNGWVETKTDMLNHLETGYLDYHTYVEDSMEYRVQPRVAHVRFIADIRVAMNGKEGNYHLKVLEVWIRKKKNWILFARQAVR